MKEYFNVADIFGENVFNDSVMQARLPKKVYQKLKQTMKEGKELDLEMADIIAHEMKEWAIEQGATHFTHWFQPLSGVTAEKHDSRSQNDHFLQAAFFLGLPCFLAIAADILTQICGRPDKGLFHIVIKVPSESAVI